MALRYEIPGAEDTIEIEHLVCDVNGTLTDRGTLVAGVAERIGRLRTNLEIHLLSADTRGRMAAIARTLDVPAVAIGGGDEKRAFIANLGSDRCAALGNGLNDASMLTTARIGIAVVGPEGASSAAVAAADIICQGPAPALDLLLDPLMLASTLRP